MTIANKRNALVEKLRTLASKVSPRDGNDTYRAQYLKLTGYGASEDEALTDLARVLMQTHAQMEGELGL